MILALAAAVVPSASAAAYWESLPGTGVGAGTTEVLAPPSDVTVPVTSGAAVPVDWTRSTGPLTPTGYYVTRHAGADSVAACDTGPASLVDAGSCTDNVGSGTGPFEYWVTAVYRTWTATGVSAGTVRIVPQAPDLGVAASFAVLGSAVTSAGATFLGGDVGTSPGTAMALTPPTMVSGTVFPGGPIADAAQAALAAAYADARSRPVTSEFAGDQIGATFAPGVHHTGAAFELTGPLILDAQGDPDAIFIFQVDAALNTAVGSSIELIGEARASNVFWQVNGAAGTGAGSVFAGTLLVNGAITIGAGGTLSGRALATGAVTLADNVVQFTEVP